MREKLLTVAKFILQYLLWLLSCAGGFYLLLRLRTTILYALAGPLGGSMGAKYTAVLVDRWGTILLAIVLIILVGITDYYYTRSKNTRHLFSRFFVVTGTELLILAAMDALMQIIIGVGARSTLTVLLFAAELVLGVLLVTHPSWWPRLFGRRSGKETEIEQT